MLAVTVFALGWFEVHNLDIHLHARTGQWIVEQGEVPRTNVLSAIHADYPSVHDKWLFQVLAHGLVDGPGIAWALVGRLVLMGLLAFALVSTGRRLGARPGALLLLVLLGLMASRTRFMFRPDLVSLVLLAFVVRTTLATRPDGRGAVLPLLLMQLLWVNVHGYFIQGPMLVFAVAAAWLLRGRAGWGTAARWAAIGLGMTAVCLLNPAGVDGLLHPFAILADLREHYDFYSGAIREFRGSFATDFRGSYDRIAFFAVGAASGLGLACRWWTVGRKARAAGRADSSTDSSLGWPACMVFVLLGVQTLSLRRNMAPFAVALAPVAAATLSQSWAAVRGRAAGSGRALVVPTLLAAVIIVGEVTDHTSVHEGLDRRWGWGESTRAYPDTGIGFIAEHLPTAGVWTDFHYGSTFTGRRWPEQVAATNGNTHGYPTSWLQDVMDATNGRDPLSFDRITREHRLDVALVPMASALSLGLVLRHDWVLVCLGREEAVYVRRAALAATLSDGRAWLDEHDLTRRWRAGEAAGLLDTPVPGSILGLPRAATASTEIDQTLLLMTAGEPALARARAARALALVPDDVWALGLSGLLAAGAGEETSARQQLQRSLDGGLTGPLAERVRSALEAL